MPPFNKKEKQNEIILKSVSWPRITTIVSCLLVPNDAKSHARLDS